MTTTIDDVTAVEVLDSRGNPTVQVSVESDGHRGTFIVPSGASTGSHEAHERRDGDGPFHGRGVRNAIRAIDEELTPEVIGHDVREQRALDELLVEIDGTERLDRIGSNAVLGVSGAALRTAAAVAGKPLYRYLADEHARTAAPGLPTPMVNIWSGGLHAAGGIEVQDVLVVPLHANTFREAIEVVWEVRQAVREGIVAAGYRPLVADEGGFSPPVRSVEEAFRTVIDGIETAGYDPGTDVALAIDVAAVHFYDDDADRYRFDSVGESLSPAEMVDRVVRWVETYPVVSVEDPLDEDDWEGWERLASALPSGIQLLGDDLLVTSVDRLSRAIDRDAASAVLVKPNQAGTMSRAFNVIEAATDADIAPVVSARSGETCDDTITDLATGYGAGQIKIGSLARSERLSKYNRALEIEASHGVPYDDINCRLPGE